MTEFLKFKRKFEKKPVLEVPHNVATKPLLSVCVQTFQHIKYIRKCLDTILEQKTTFQFEILLGEDDSTDGTRKICQEYAEQYPDKIRLFLHHRENNIRINDSPTGRFNFVYNLFSARGEYIAFCEGDDYWSDQYKLQKQVDFLEQNENFGICFHNVGVYNLIDLTKSVLPDVKKETIFNIQDYLLDNKTATCSMVFKKEKLGVLPNWFFQLPFGDLALTIIILKNSNEKAMVLKDIMGVYHIHSGGVHGSFHSTPGGLIKAYLQHLQFTKIISTNFLPEKKYRKVFLQKMFNTLKVLAVLYKDCHKDILFLKTTIRKKYYRFLLRIN